MTQLFKKPAHLNILMARWPGLINFADKQNNPLLSEFEILPRRGRMENCLLSDLSQLRVFEFSQTITSSASLELVQNLLGVA